MSLDIAPLGGPGAPFRGLGSVLQERAKIAGRRMAQRWHESTRFYGISSFRPSVNSPQGDVRESHFGVHSPIRYLSRTCGKDVPPVLARCWMLPEHVRRKISVEGKSHAFRVARCRNASSSAPTRAFSASSCDHSRGSCADSGPLGLR
jgi:hypothetical protein